MGAGACPGPRYGPASRRCSWLAASYMVPHGRAADRRGVIYSEDDNAKAPETGRQEGCADQRPRRPQVGSESREGWREEDDGKRQDRRVTGSGALLQTRERRLHLDDRVDVLA